MHASFYIGQRLFNRGKPQVIGSSGPLWDFPAAMCSGSAPLLSPDGEEKKIKKKQRKGQRASACAVAIFGGTAKSHETSDPTWQKNDTGQSCYIKS